MQTGARILVVEDDPTVRTVVGDHLRTAGCEVELSSDGRAGLAAFRRHAPDLLIVDRMLPGISGDELCRIVRETSSVPIIMLTALDGVAERIDGLEHGADDYVTKPFSLRELQLRVEVQLRHAVASTAPIEFAAGPFRVDPAHRRVWVQGREVALTAREYELFLYLVQHPGRVIRRDEIVREVWQWGFGDPSTVTVHVRRLREKIESDPRFPCYLRTEWGAGYRFELEQAQPC